MFVLIESSRSVAPARGVPSGAASFVVHSLLAALAVWFTRPVAEVLTPPDLVVPLFWSPPPGRVSPAPVAAVPSAPRPGVLALPQDVPVDVPPPPLPGTTLPGWSEPGVLPGDPGTPVVPGAVPGGLPVPAPAAPIDARYAEEAPRLLSHPPLRYPELLRQAGIEGRVVLEAVLDTLGRVEPASLRVVRGAQSPFEAEARSVALASRYRPARVSGRPVRVRIQLPVEFTLRR